MCEINLNNIDGTSCEPTGGVAAEVLFAPVADFTTIGQPPETMEDYETLGELARVSAAHAFPAGKGFSKVKGVQEMGTLKFTRIGEKKGGAFQNEMTFEVSGHKDELLGFARLTKNADLVVMCQEVSSGDYRQFGSKRFPAYITVVDGNIEAAIEGKNSIAFTVQDKQKWPAPVYPSTLAVVLKGAGGGT